MTDHEVLEDDFTYVIRKAFKGLALSPSEAAVRAGLAEGEVLAFSRGEFSAAIAQQLAPVLGLNPQALARHARYLPEPLAQEGIARLDLPFEHERVNAWLIHYGETVILFDTGYNPGSCAAALASITPEFIFITHHHVDHIGGIPDFLVRGVIPHGPSIADATPMQPGATLVAGALTIRACDLSGHAMPALGYFIEGFPQPILVTGDALFAGSMGGCTTPQVYQHALAQLREILAPLPDATILLPGHGPATTLGEERVSNPFLSSNWQHGEDLEAAEDTKRPM